jgi:hypothetical protein
MGSKVSVRVALLEPRATTREQLRNSFSQVSGEAPIVVGVRDDPLAVVKRDGCNAVFMNLELLGSDKSISFIEALRDKGGGLSHIPICIVDNYASVLGSKHADWKTRLAHYYSFPFAPDDDESFKAQVAVTERLFRFYLGSPEADFKLRELREQVSSPDSGMAQSHRVKVIDAFLNVAEAIQARDVEVSRREWVELKVILPLLLVLFLVVAAGVYGLNVEYDPPRVTITHALNEIEKPGVIVAQINAEGYDYVALENSTDFPIDLSGYEIWNGNKRYAIPAGSGSHSRTIPPKGRLRIGFVSAGEALSGAGDLESTAFRIETSDRIELKDQSGVVLHELIAP